MNEAQAHELALFHERMKEFGITRATTFVGDFKYPEFWAASVRHDLDYEGVGAAKINTVFAEECGKISLMLHTHYLEIHARFLLGYHQYDWAARQRTRKEADKAFGEYMARVIERMLKGVERDDYNGMVITEHHRINQMRRVRRQRLRALRAPKWLKDLFLKFNKLIGGK